MTREQVSLMKDFNCKELSIQSDRISINGETIFNLMTQHQEVSEKVYIYMNGQCPAKVQEECTHTNLPYPERNHRANIAVLKKT
jgi:hypothetical protein